MNRREALRNVTFWVGGALTVTTLGVLNQGCQPKPNEKEDLLFNKDQEMTIAEMADTIIPDTDTPGAKAAGVGPFIVMMISDCYPENIQKIFINGIDEVRERAVSDYNKSFIAMSSSERETLLKKIEKEAEDQKRKHVEREVKDVFPHFFELVKELTLLGYFTSEIGATQALNYIQIPGKYDGCVPLKKGQKAWAT